MPATSDPELQGTGVPPGTLSCSPSSLLIQPSVPVNECEASYKVRRLEKTIDEYLKPIPVLKAFQEKAAKASRDFDVMASGKRLAECDAKICKAKDEIRLILTRHPPSSLKFLEVNIYLRKRPQLA